MQQLLLIICCAYSFHPGNAFHPCPSSTRWEKLMRKTDEKNRWDKPMRKTDEKKPGQQDDSAGWKRVFCKGVNCVVENFRPFFNNIVYALVIHAPCCKNSWVFRGNNDIKTMIDYVSECEWRIIKVWTSVSALLGWKVLLQHLNICWTISLFPGNARQCSKCN